MAPPLVTRDFILLVIAHFLQALGYSSMLLLPLYLQHLEASRTEIGALMATAAVSGLLVKPFIAWALDVLGRKPTLIVGTVILVIGMLMIYGIDSIGPYAYVERAVFGVGVAALFSGYFTFAADIIPSERRTEGLALFGASGLVPLLVNPFADQLAIDAPDLRWFLPAVGLVIVPGLLALFVLPEPPKTEAQNDVDMRLALKGMLQRPLWPVWVASIGFSGLVAVFMTFATVAAERRGVGDPSSLWLTYALGAVFVRLFGARLPDRVGPSKLVVPALGIYVAAMWLSSGATTFMDFSIAALCAGVGHGYCFPVLSSQVVTRAPDEFRGSAFSFFTALWALSELVLSPAFGAVADAHGDATMFHYAAAFGVSIIALWALLEYRYGKLGLSPGHKPLDL